MGLSVQPALELFEKTITLDTSGLNEENYSVDVYGVSKNFTLDTFADSDDTCS